MVNVCSVSSYVDLPLSAAYCASKAALLSLTNCLRMEVQPLRVNMLGGRAFSPATANIGTRTLAERIRGCFQPIVQGQVQ